MLAGGIPYNSTTISTSVKRLHLAIIPSSPFSQSSFHTRLSIASFWMKWREVDVDRLYSRSCMCSCRMGPPSEEI